LFLAAIIAGIFIYQKAVKFVIRKFNLEDKMEPLFSHNRRGPRD